MRAEIRAALAAYQAEPRWKVLERERLTRAEWIRDWLLRRGVTLELAEVLQLIDQEVKAFG